LSDIAASFEIILFPLALRAPMTQPTLIEVEKFTHPGIYP